LIGLVTFAGASGICGLASSALTLNLARALQGLGARTNADILRRLAGAVLLTFALVRRAETTPVQKSLPGECELAPQIE
jgi:hypothetical protein